MVQITPTVNATDNRDPSSKIEFVGIKISEPDDGQGDGNTTNDVRVTADGKHFVQAERSAKNNGRIYTITYKATDTSGNVGYASATVTVLKSQGSK